MGKESSSNLYDGGFLFGPGWYRDVIPKKYVGEVRQGIFRYTYAVLPGYNKREFLDDNGQIDFTVVGGKHPQLTIVFGGMGESSKNPKSFRNYASPGGMATYYLMGCGQFIVIDPPHSKYEPISFSQNIASVKDLLEAVLSYGNYTQPVQLRLLGQSLGCLYAIHLLQELKDASIAGIPINELSLITPAGITPDGIEHIQKLMERGRSSDGSWKVMQDGELEPHVYAANFFDELKEVKPIDSVIKVAKEGMNVIMIPENPTAKGAFLLPNEFNLLWVSTITPNIHMIQPLERFRHHLGHQDADIAYCIALGVPSNLWPTLSRPAVRSSDYTIKDDIQSGIITILDARLVWTLPRRKQRNPKVVRFPEAT